MDRISCVKFAGFRGGVLVLVLTAGFAAGGVLTADRTLFDPKLSQYAYRKLFLDPNPATVNFPKRSSNLLEKKKIHKREAEIYEAFRPLKRYVDENLCQKKSDGLFQPPKKFLRMQISMNQKRFKTLRMKRQIMQSNSAKNQAEIIKRKYQTSSLFGGSSGKDLQRDPTCITAGRQIQFRPRKAESEGGDSGQGSSRGGVHVSVLGVSDQGKVTSVLQKIGADPKPKKPKNKPKTAQSPVTPTTEDSSPSKPEEEMAASVTKGSTQAANHAGNQDNKNSTATAVTEGEPKVEENSNSTSNNQETTISAETAVSEEGQVQETCVTEPGNEPEEDTSVTEPDNKEEEDTSVTEPENKQQEDTSVTEPEIKQEEEARVTEPEIKQEEEARVTEPDNKQEEEPSIKWEPQTEQEVEETTTTIKSGPETGDKADQNTITQESESKEGNDTTTADDEGQQVLDQDAQDSSESKDRTNKTRTLDEEISEVYQKVKIPTLNPEEPSSTTPAPPTIRKKKKKNKKNRKKVSKESKNKRLMETTEQESTRPEPEPELVEEKPDNYASLNVNIRKEKKSRVMASRAKSARLRQRKLQNAMLKIKAKQARQKTLEQNANRKLLRAQAAIAARLDREVQLLASLSNGREEKKIFFSG